MGIRQREVEDPLETVVDDRRRVLRGDHQKYIKNSQRGQVGFGALGAARREDDVDCPDHLLQIVPQKIGTAEKHVPEQKINGEYKFLCKMVNCNFLEIK